MRATKGNRCMRTASHTRGDKLGYNRIGKRLRCALAAEGPSRCAAIPCTNVLPWSRNIGLTWLRTDVLPRLCEDAVP